MLWINTIPKILPKIYSCLLYIALVQKTLSGSRLEKANTQLSSTIINQLPTYMETNVTLTVLLLL